MKKLLPACVLVLIVLVNLVACKEEDAKGAVLRFNLEKGKTYEYDMVWDFDMETMGQPQKMGLQATYSMKVDGEEGNTKLLTTTYQRFRLDVTVGGINMEIDTDKPVEPFDPAKGQTDQLMGRLFSGIRGKQFTFKVDEKGTVTEVSGFDQIIRSMIDSAGLDESARMQAELSLKDQFNDQSIRDQFAQVFNIYPNKVVKKGDSWNTSYEQGGRMPSKNEVVYTVKEIKGDKITLDFTTTISSPDAGKNLSGKQTGVMEVDLPSGLVTSTTLVQEMTSETDGMRIVIKGKGKVKGKETGH